MPKHQEEDILVRILPQTLINYTLSQIDLNTFYYTHRESGQGHELPRKDFDDMLAAHHAKNF